MQPIAPRPGGTPAPLAGPDPRPTTTPTAPPDTTARVGWAPTATAAPHAHRARLEAAVQGLDGLTDALWKAGFADPRVPGRIEGRGQALARALAAISQGLVGAGLDHRIEHAPAIRRGMRMLADWCPEVARRRGETLRTLDALLDGARLPDGATAESAWQDRLTPVVAGLRADDGGTEVQDLSALETLLRAGRGPAGGVAAELILGRLGGPDALSGRDLTAVLRALAWNLADAEAVPSSATRLLTAVAAAPPPLPPARDGDLVSALRSLLFQVLRPLPRSEIPGELIRLAAGEMAPSVRADLLGMGLTSFRWPHPRPPDSKDVGPQLAALLRQRAADLHPEDLGDTLRTRGHLLDPETIGRCLDVIGDRARAGTLSPEDARMFLLCLGDRYGRRSERLGVDDLVRDLHNGVDPCGRELAGALRAPERAEGMTAIIELAALHDEGLTALAAERAKPGPVTPAAEPQPTPVPPARLAGLRSVLGLLEAGGDLAPGMAESLLAHPKIRGLLADPELDAARIVTTISAWPGVTLDPLAKLTLLDTLSGLA
jgi:hypothetical protein